MTFDSHVLNRWEPRRPGVDIHRRQEILDAIGRCQAGDVDAIKGQFERELTEHFAGEITETQGEHAERTVHAVFATAKAMHMPVVGAHLSEDGTAVVLEFPPENVMTPKGFG